MKEQGKSSSESVTSTAVEKPLIKSPTDCSKRHERMLFWLSQPLHTDSMVGYKFDWEHFNIDWSTITVEDLMCHTLISRAINNGEYNAVVAIWNTRYGMLKGGDYVDDGTDDKVETFFGDLPEEVYPDRDE